MSSTLAEQDMRTIDSFVEAARAANLSRFSGEFHSHVPMHKSGYSTVKFTWEAGRHGAVGSIHIQWDSTVRVQESAL